MATRARHIAQARSPGPDEARLTGFESLSMAPACAGIIMLLGLQGLGSPVVLAELGLLAIVIAAGARKHAAFAVRSAAWLLPLALLAIASAAWSEVPRISARYGIQLGLTIAIGIVVAASIAREKLPLVVFLGLGAAIVLGIASGRTGMSPEGPVLIGFAGSKNQMAYNALFWLASALCVMVTRRYRLPLRMVAAAGAVLAALVIWQANAVTALVTMIALVALLVLLALAAWLPRGGRLFCLFAGALLLGVGSVATAQIEDYATTVRSDVLGKDARLTGRTLLWESADRLIAEEPVLGHGYKAIWLGRTGVGLLARNGQSDGRTFHFHDTVRELSADLGLVGLTLFALPLAWGIARLVGVLIERVTPGSAMIAAFVAMLCLRMRTELIIAPLLLDTALMAAALSSLLGARRTARPLLFAEPRLSRSRPPVRRPTRGIAHAPTA